MTKQYNTLWVDDEWEELFHIRQLAKENNIRLYPFSNAEEAIDEIEKNLVKYDAIILDGLFYNKKEEGGTPTKQLGLMNVIKEIEARKKDKKIPWFILTGKTSVKKDSTAFLESQKKLDYIYDKLDTIKLEELFNQLKLEANKQPNTQIRHSFQNVFKICHENCLGDKYEGKLLGIIKDLNTSFQNFTELRMIYEALFERLAELNILPEDFLNEKGWISGASYFLSEKHNGYDFKEPGFIHPLIANSLYRSLLIMQDGSHYAGTLKLQVSSFIIKHKTNYTYKSVVYAFLEVIAHFAELILKNLDSERNKERWEKNHLFELVIQQDKLGNYYSGEVLFKHGEVNGKFEVGQKVKVYEILENINERTNHLYAKFTDKFGF